jgi:stage III sporulation protein AA
MNTKEILDILPLEIKSETQNIPDLNKLQEVRIKVNKPLIFQVGSEEIINSYKPTHEDVKFVLQKISNYSIYAFEEEIKQGYITIKGGHRVGLCGSCVIQNEGIKTIKDIASLNIRVCREVTNSYEKVINLYKKI